MFLGFAVLYDGLILILSYVFFTSITFSIRHISVTNGSIGITGDADVPTLLFALTKNPVVFLRALFIIWGMSTAVIITVVSFKNSCSMQLCITAVVFLIVTAILFVLIPPRAFTAKLYDITGNMFLIRIFYYLVILSGDGGESYNYSQKGSYKMNNAENRIAELEKRIAELEMEKQLQAESKKDK